MKNILLSDCIVLIFLNVLWIPFESFLRQYPRQLPRWRHTLQFFFFIYSLSSPSPWCLFGSFFLWISLKNLPFKQARSCKSGSKQAQKMGERLRPPNLSVCLPLPALEHRACKSFSCKALSQPPLAPFQKCAACFRKMEGTSLHGECCLPTLLTTAPSLSFPLFLSDSDERLLFYPLFDKPSCLFRSLWHNED